AGAAAIVPAIAGSAPVDEATQVLTPGLVTQEATRILPAAAPAPEEEEVAEEKRRSPWTWPLVALIVILLLVLGGTVFAMMSGSGGEPAPSPSQSTPSESPPPSETPTPEPTTVPMADLDFIDRTCDEARSIAAEHNLTAVTCVPGSAAATADDVGKIYQTDPSGGNVTLDQSIVLTFYDEQSPIATPTAPTVVNNPQGSTSYTVTWQSFSCPAGSSLTAFNMTVINGTFAANNDTTYQAPASPRSLAVTANANIAPGSLILVSYTAQCGDRESAASPEGQAAIPSETPATPAAPDPTSTPTPDSED
ncbi:MAG: serine/threonine protein kinase, partial [Microbacterium sp.]